MAPAGKPLQDLSEDVDSYYCPHCLENMPSSEAMLCGMRCSKCWECPVCSSTLTPCIANPSSKEQTYHFACSYCRWSSKGSWAVFSTSSSSSTSKNDFSPQRMDMFGHVSVQLLVGCFAHIHPLWPDVSFLQKVWLPQVDRKPTNPNSSSLKLCPQSGRASLDSA